MRELLRKDITIRVASVIFAVVLWFSVRDLNNPIGTKTIQIPLEIKNEQALQDKGIVIKNKNFSQNVELTVKGRKDRLANLSAGDFSALVDLSKIKSPDEKELTIDGPYYTGGIYNRQEIEINDTRPKTIKLELEKISRNTFKVDVVATGKMREGYKAVRISAVPDTVVLQGFDSVLGAVASVKAYVDLTNLDRDTLVNKKECKVFGADGNEISQFSKTNFVDIRVETAKEVPVTPVINGKPAKDYIDSSVSVKPDKVLITGTPDVLSGITSIKTEPLNIENKSSSIIDRKNLQLPNGVRLFYENTSQVSVNVTLEQMIVKDFTIKSGDISIVNSEVDNSLDYSLVNDSVKVSLKGNTTVLERIDSSGIKASVDVGKKQEGVYKLPLSIQVPDSVKIMGDYTVDVKIDKR
ncbi:MAG TPA: CdaR family protein [Clostridia bacterium]